MIMQRVKLIAVGDISLRTRNNKYPFENIKETLKNKDILFGNLETVLSSKGKAAEKAVLRYSSPKNVEHLKSAGFDVLNIANNHIFDLGLEGFSNTLDVLYQNDLTYIGANNKPGKNYVIVEKKGIKFGFLGYTQDGFSLPEKGVCINKIEKTDIIKDIEYISPQCEFVIISLHWGIQNAFYPSPKQINFAHKLIDAGATVILGHHPQVIQGIERYTTGLIAYSLGIFQYDPKLPKRNKSIILCLNFNRERLESYEIIPVIIGKNFLPGVAEDELKDEVGDFITKTSQPLNNGHFTERWWFEEIAAECLSGNMKSWIIRIKKYGIRHFFQCIKWLISPFTIRCYVGFLSKKLKGRQLFRNCGLSLRSVVSRENNKQKIAIIGPYPPPHGGISVHIKRMHEALLKRNLEHVIYTNTETKEKNVVRVANSKKWLLKYSLSAKENIIHFHSIDWRERILIGVMGFLSKKVVLTIHGQTLNDQINQGNWLKKRMLAWALRNISTIIVVNLRIKDLIVSLGIKSENIEIIPSLIPPTIRKGEIAEIPPEIWDFIDSHTPIISANGSRIVFYNNQDLYGIDMCIDLCANLKNAYPKIGFVFCLPNIGDCKYFEKTRQRIVEHGIENNFRFQTKSCEFYPILMKSNVFVRPTNTDGDAVSLREALYFEVPLIASDVCARPEGTILFKNRDIDDFTLKVKDVLDNYGRYKKSLETVSFGDNFEKIMKVYQKLGK